MAKLSIYGTPTTSRIRVRIVEMDTNWAQGERYAHFYISDSGYSTSSSDYDGMLTLDEGISQSPTYSFTGLEPDTRYYISCVIKRGDTGATIVTFTISEWTEAEVGVRPADWNWTSTIAQDKPINLTAAEWIAFCNRINAFREYKQLSAYSFTVPVAGSTKISASIVNQARTAIESITGHGTLPSAAVTGSPITASFFNQLRTALNAVP